ncbi:hypothetical protein ONS95_009309 [Cadophora gregata]|uniref:uncharacterized protein n=1 Tax=Cadophora gregata TaxID=51156 RepID=UPI0026DC4C2E|nr:uncharacterized protein ONS95_009309 [Cadophora gregata]KAK0124340.1 hypothetical protein ONS95_009309 [Cadophora gregata]KAK0129805.1 hypothetical protein ONS96_000357 [Cadophora gregata f. sp. sojae]
MDSSQPATASPTTTFQDFRRLPPELRIMIWHLAARQVRVVEIELVSAKFKGLGWIDRYTSKTLALGILHACGESRWIGLKRYEKIKFDGIFSGSYVNWNVDYIGFTPSNSQGMSCLLRDLVHRSDSRRCEVLKRCHRLISSEPIPDINHYYHIRRFLQGFKNLEEIDFLFPEHVGDWRERSGNIKIAPMVNALPHEQKKMDGYMNDSRLQLIREKIPGFKGFDAMRCVRELGRHLSSPEITGRGVLYPDKTLILSRPKLPKRVNFKSYRLPELGNAAKDLGLSDKGLKKDLIVRLEAADVSLFREEMREYQLEMLEYSANVDRLLVLPKVPGRKPYENDTKKQL